MSISNIPTVELEQARRDHHAGEDLERREQLLLGAGGAELEEVVRLEDHADGIHDGLLGLQASVARALETAVRALGVPGADAGPLDPRLPDEARVEEAEVLTQKEPHAGIEVLLRLDEVERRRQRGALVADACAEGGIVAFDTRALAAAPVAVELK